MRSLLFAPALAGLLLAGCGCADILVYAVAVDVRDGTGAAISDFELECTLDGQPIEATESACGPLVAGRYGVRVTRGEQVIERELDVAWAPGARDDCRFPDTRMLTVVFLAESAP